MVRKKAVVDKSVQLGLQGCTMISVLVTVMIIGSVFFETVRFFDYVSVADFLFGTEWSPQIALRADQSGSSGTFGFIPILTGTLLITFIAMCIAAPVGLFAAIYLSSYATARIRTMVKPVLEILAGIPSVVYGYFAVITVAPALRGFGDFIGLSIASESALTAGLVMGVMITPYVMSLSEDSISAVPKTLRDGSLAMGATQAETITKVILPAATPGIVSAILLGVSRGVGETMIVVMAAGMAANLTINPLEPVTTATVQIVTLLVGDHEFDSEKTLAAFALGFALFIITLVLNIVALLVIKRYRRRYG